MANVNAPRDENRVPVGIGQDGSSNTLPIRVDPATSRLLLDISVTTDRTPPTIPQEVRDDNHVPISMAVTDNAAATVGPLIIDTSNGYLYVDVLVEP